MVEKPDPTPRFEPGPQVNTAVFLLSIFISVSLSADLILYFEIGPEFRTTVLAFGLLKYGFVGLAWIVLLVAGKVAARIRHTRH